MMLRAVDSVCRSDTGLQRRENEDSAYAAAPLFVVADGMGGAQAGEVASRLAIEVFAQGLDSGGSPEERLAARVRDANRQIYDRSRVETGREGMGTTLTAAYLDDGQVAIAHVGDSRAYLFRDGELTRLTQDHSLVDELVRRGKLTEEQAAEHPQRSIITRALGPEPDVEVDTFTYPVRAGDVLLLCSDGLTSMISEDAVSRVLGSAESLDEAARSLIREANEAGGRDNITVVLFRLEEVAVGGQDASGEDHDTIIEAPSRGLSASSEPHRSAAPPGASSVAVAPGPASRIQPRPAEPRRAERSPRSGRRHTRLVATLVAVLVVVLLVGGGGYLATRQLYFIGTNAQGIVTIYRGLPYDLPAGIPLYETYFVSGVPASLVPADRRRQLFNNQLRSQSDAQNLVRNLELGRVSR
jgi:serine/threonine protein phosphatase PrpC